MCQVATRDHKMVDTILELRWYDACSPYPKYQNNGLKLGAARGEGSLNSLRS